MPEVSIVVPLYNKEKHIGETLRSVLCQTFDDFEIIIVNDGSTDNSMDVVSGFSDSRLRAFNQQNSGVSAARNRGILEARSGLIAFLDADDQWKPEFLVTILRLRKNYPGAGVYATAFEIKNGDGTIERPSFEALPQPPWEGLIPDYFRSVLGETPVWTSAAAVPADVFKTLGMFTEGHPLGEDQDMWCRIALKYPVAFSNTTCSTYLQGAQNSACWNNIIYEELPVVTTLRNAVKNREIPGTSIKYAREYLAKIQLVYAYSLLSRGEVSKARTILLSTRTRHFAKKKLLLYKETFKNTWVYRIYKKIKLILLQESNQNEVEVLDYTKRLAVIIDNLSFGGAQIQTIELLNRFCKRGFKILLLCLGSDMRLAGRLQGNIEIVALKKRAYFDPLVLCRIAKNLKRFKPGRLLAVNTYSMMYGYLATLLHDSRLVKSVVIHTTVIRSLKEKLQNLIYIRIVNRMQKVIFVCKNQKQYWLRKYGIKPSISNVVHNGIDIERYSDFKPETEKLRTELGIFCDDIVIGINACLRPEKKHENLINAVEMLVNKGYKIKLLIVGDGERRILIEKLIHSKNLSSQVIITGFVKDVRPYVACMDITVLCSTAVESFSIAILESMAMAKPVVISDTGGARELVEHMYNGMVYPPANVKLLYASLKYIIDNKLFTIMGQRSQEKVMELYGIERMVERYIQLI